MKSILINLLIGMICSQALALSERKIGGVPITQKILKYGVPSAALKRVMSFIDAREKKTIELKEDGETRHLSISNLQFLTIIDFTLPSSKRRLYLIDLWTGDVAKYYVAHGISSGGDLPTVFSNIRDSNQSSLGIYLTGSPYIGKHGKSLRLHGLEKSNSRAWERSIVFHGAEYVSLEFLEEHNRMGRSFGCPAVSKEMAAILIPKIAEGSIMYIHHETLIKEAQTSPNKQVLKVAQPKPVEPPKPVVSTPTPIPTTTTTIPPKVVTTTTTTMPPTVKPAVQTPAPTPTPVVPPKPVVKPTTPVTTTTTMAPKPSVPISTPVVPAKPATDDDNDYKEQQENHATDDNRPDQPEDNPPPTAEELNQ